MTDGGNWTAVGEAVRDRKRELGMSTARLARETGLSETTIRYIGQPARHNKSSLVAIAAALRWRHDHLTNILHGESHKNARTRQPPLEILKAEMTALNDTVRQMNEKLDALLNASCVTRPSAQKRRRTPR